MSEPHQTDAEAFYIGWQGETAPGLARFVRKRVIAVLMVGLGLAAGIAATQAPYGASRFEFGVERSFEGQIELSPYPLLIVDRPGAERTGVTATSRWLLTVFGKRGADSAVSHLAGHRVRLTGTLIDRDGITMVELLPESLEDLGEATVADAAPTAVTAATLRGEIVDSKCYLGVMKPGNLKVHRACATRCISGGVPPVLMVRRPDGTARYVLLVDANGDAVNDRILHMVAEPVEISGALSRLGDLEVLRADPMSYRRLGSGPSSPQAH
ncbi:MAG: hypothetical protein P8R43_08865 [Planctomycetota bacterium]|nr:hypothetical protein [Planctomycetota bacterium]